MFRFREKSRGPFHDTRSVDRWFASLPANDPLAVQRAVTPELDKLADEKIRRTPAELKAVFAMDEQVRGHVANLRQQYAEHSIRSARIETQIWQSLFDLTQSFQGCYAAFAGKIRDLPQRGKMHELLPELIARQIIHLVDDARIRLYRCDRWIPGKWAELHAPFMRACSNRIERTPVTLNPNSGPTTIEHEYLVALVLQLADPGDLTPKQIEWVSSRLDQWCRPLRLSIEQPSNTPFYIDLAASNGLRRRGLGALEGRVLFVDMEPLHTRLMRERAALEQKLRNDPHSDSAMGERPLIELLGKLANRFSPEFKPLPRSGDRKAASGAVDAIIGFSSILGYLHDVASGDTSARAASRSFGNAMELAIFGRARAGPEAQAEAAQRRIAEFAAPGGAWQMKDMSSSGFRLHAPMSVATEVTLSMLVAIHQRADDSWAMGIVRRMRRLSSKNAEIGLQLIAHSLVGAELYAQPKSRDGDDARNGPPTLGVERRFRGLLLSFAGRPGEAASESLIVPSIEYQPGRRCRLETAEHATRAIRFGRVYEQQADWNWVAVEPVVTDAATGDATAAV